VIGEKAEKFSKDRENLRNIILFDFKNVNINFAISDDFR